MRVASLFLIVVLWSCGSDTHKTNSLFEVIDSKTSGLTFNNTLKDTDDQNIIEYLYYYNGGGVAVGDINNDGLDDVFFTANQSSDKLFLNKGNMKFEDITKSSGIFTDASWSSGVTMDDVNNDGLLDIYVCRVKKFCSKEHAHNLLYINQGNNTFKEMSKELGLNFSGYSTQACFLDYDNDGDLDAYLLNHTIHSVRSYGSAEKRVENDSLSGDLFFENKVNETGKFENVTKQAGIYNSPLGYGLAVTCGDVNGDGYTDIYVGNDFHENDYIYINNGNKTFTESIKQYCAHTTQFSMGVDIADVNNDGWNDIFTTDMMPYKEEVAMVSGGEDNDDIKRVKKDLGYELQQARNHFQLNTGKGHFSEVAFATRTFATDWSWSPLVQDFDHNGYNDIFVTSGIFKRPNDLDYINFLNDLDSTKVKNEKERTKLLIEKMPSQPLQNILFAQTSPLQFTKVGQAFVSPAAFSTGAAYSDLDNDGDLDLITNNINRDAFILKNTTNNTQFLKVKLSDGKNPQRDTKGSVVKVYTKGGDVLTKEFQTTKGFMSSSSHVLHFGLGNNEKIDSVTIDWKDGLSTTLKEVQKGTMLNVDKSKTSTFRKEQTASSINDNVSMLPFRHIEDQYYDENSEKLIPERLSYEGPALLTEDLDGDGITDVFWGGARNQPSRLMLGTPKGGFKEVSKAEFDRDAKYEDVAAATIDFDGDGDKDLYVVSGGNDLIELHKGLEDRIYLNNGKGDFKRIPISLPHTNGSCIAVSDFDKDGFQDLFVGARNIPLHYGLSPYSFLLKNNKGQGVSIVAKERYGMLTDAKWADIDGDKDDDLVLCGDWMPVLVLTNENGIMKDATSAFGIDSIKGFWNTVELVDVNQDGKLDILAGNMGSNVKFNASKQHPIKLYTGDFDGNSSSDPLIFYYYTNRYMPFASYDKIASHLPAIKKNFRTYQAFSKVKAMEDMFKDYQKAMISYKEVNELRSMIFLSNGSKYEAIPLGFYEQLSDINDFVVDGENICYVGNRNAYVAELGPCYANAGRILSGFDKASKKFLHSEALNLPIKKVYSKMGRLSPQQYFIAVNNEEPMIYKN